MTFFTTCQSGRVQRKRATNKTNKKNFASRNTMNMPGFTAEWSAYRTSGHYQMTASSYAYGSSIRPQQGCDLECLGTCPDACSDLEGRLRLECLRSCRRLCGCGPPPQQVCGSCDRCDPLTGWSQECCRPNGTNCSRRACTPPEECSVEDNRICLPPPFDSICWGSCTRTCCRWSGCDQRLCGVSPC
jgi:hypothetical protein